MTASFPAAVSFTPIASRHVVAIPYPGRGHLYPLLSFSKQALDLSNPKISFTFVVTEEWLDLIRSSSSSFTNEIRFATIPNVLPSELTRGAIANRRAFYEAVETKLQEPIERILDDHQPPQATIDLLLVDPLLTWTFEAGRRRNVPVAAFWPLSAQFASVFCHFEMFVDHRHYPAKVSENGEERADYVPGMSPVRLTDLPDAFRGNEMAKNLFLQSISNIARSSHCVLLRSVSELESPAIDAIRTKLSVPVYPIGPSLPHFFSSGNMKLSSSTSSVVKEEEDVEDDCSYYFQWLNSKPEKSVLYVSFGSYLSVSSMQREEILHGLEDSGVYYLLVDCSNDDFLKNPLGSAGGDHEQKGMIVPWCDQARVLAHSSVGGFVSHCGLSSMFETAMIGVPVLTFPLGADQGLNSNLVVENWGIGWRLRTGMGTEELVTRDRVSETVKKFIDLESGERKTLEKRSKELRETIRRSMGKGGSCETHLTEFVESILLLSKD